MWRFTLSVLAISLFLFGCTKRESIVVVDDWWNVDFAKNGCELRAHSGNPCIGDPVSGLRDFEAQLSTAFVTDPSCRGVVLARFDGPVGQSSDTASKAGWQLMLSFIEGEASQQWSMVHRTGDNSYRTGQGNPSETAHFICAVVNHTGGLEGRSIDAVSRRYIRGGWFIWLARKRSDRPLCPRAVCVAAGSQSSATLPKNEVDW